MLRFCSLWQLFCVCNLQNINGNKRDIFNVFNPFLSIVYTAFLTGDGGEVERDQRGGRHSHRGRRIQTHQGNIRTRKSEFC